MSTTGAQADARAVISMLAALGNKVTSFTGGAGPVTTTGYIEKEGDEFGGEVTATDNRYIASMLIDDVGTVHRGDRVTDEDGVEWLLLEERANSDPWTTDWYCERR